MRAQLKKLWRDWRTFALFVAVMLVFRSAVADWNQVPSGSMYPSIFIGDRIVVNKLAYDLRIPFTLQRIARWHDPERGDIVTFASPEDERLLVKRIVAIPGDTVSLDRNELVINEQRASYEPLTAEHVRQLPVGDVHRYEFLRESILGSERLVMRFKSGNTRMNSFPTIEVPSDHYLVMGDNRDNSRDSRSIGFVSRDRIFGRAQTVAFSLDYDKYYAPRMERFFAHLP
ncbi:MAG: signal peptidase I [Gammaproteobacteria bacterium]|nr:signal peptidase I [Gammaproteobacteria bacterium]